MLKTCETPHFRSALASLSRGKRKAAHVRTTPPIHKMAIKKGRVLILAIGRDVNLLSSFSGLVTGRRFLCKAGVHCRVLRICDGDTPVILSFSFQWRGLMSSMTPPFAAIRLVMRKTVYRARWSRTV